jgi:hypothetical protein
VKEAATSSARFASVGGAKSPPLDEIAMAGLDRAHVDQFIALGFERAKVVCGLLSIKVYFFLILHFLDRCSSTLELSRSECRQDQ